MEGILSGIGIRLPYIVTCIFLDSPPRKNYLTQYAPLYTFTVVIVIDTLEKFSKEDAALYAHCGVCGSWRLSISDLIKQYGSQFLLSKVKNISYCPKCGNLPTVVQYVARPGVTPN